ncbi:hypothetical protein H4219_002226 [Mycoemilia scoparia]|uniref:Uncharacterized protein n=1 Tax=Mycoemilia scoparia TaxID=417184 RepID=A0A9W8DV28_9FUNG|nr:hypothetical protein H4219_002226 [Mycoemilia scoparia]
MCVPQSSPAKNDTDHGSNDDANVSQKDEMARKAREFFLSICLPEKHSADERDYIPPKSAKTAGSLNNNNNNKPIRITIRDEDLEEKQIRGWGNGGQKCQDTRSLQANRKIARKRLADKLDELVNGRLSKLAKKVDKKKSQKRKRQQRARKKYGAASSKDEKVQDIAEPTNFAENMESNVNA